MKRQLDLDGTVVASFCPTKVYALTVLRRGAHGEASCMDIIGLDLHKRETQLWATILMTSEAPGMGARSTTPSPERTILLT
jgi:hypothetical protein